MSRRFLRLFDVLFTYVTPSGAVVLVIAALYAVFHKG